MFKVNKIVSAEIIRCTKTFHVGDFYYEGNHYYVKPDQDKTEIIAYNLARLNQLPVLAYQSVSVRNKNYSVSLDMKKQGNFLLAEDLFNDIYYIEDLIKSLRNLSFFTDKLALNFYQMYFFDLLFLNTDRYTRNFGFLNIDGEWNLIMFDHKNLFDVKEFPAMRFQYKGKFNLNTFYQDVADFFSYLPSNIIEEFQNMLSVYSIKTVQNIIKQVNPSIENYYMSIYIPHYEKIANLLSRGVIHGR